MYNAKYHIVNSLMESTARVMFTISYTAEQTLNIEPISTNSEASK